jgi:hypothetical protein
MTEPTVTFRATLELGGKTATGIVVPDDAVTTLGAGKRPAVRVTINGYTYRSTIARRGTRYLLPVSAEHRSAAGVAAGDEVDVRLAVDTAPREVTVPSDLAAALDANAQAKQAFERLAYSHKQRHVLAIEAAKSPETRQRRIDGAIAMLQDSPPR